MPIVALSAEDKSYLEEFNNLERLSLNQTGLKTLENFPINEDLSRLELSDNEITGDQLKHLAKYSLLHTLKLANNKLKTYEDIKDLGLLKYLKNLDLENNEVTKLYDYKLHVFRLIPSLQVLDSHNKYGELVISDDSDQSVHEGGEDEIEEGLGEDLLEEIRLKGLTPQEYMQGLGLMEQGEDDYDDEYEKHSQDDGESKRQKQ
jgi:hypothetical protein